MAAEPRVRTFDDQRASNLHTVIRVPCRIRANRRLRAGLHRNRGRLRRQVLRRCRRAEYDTTPLRNHMKIHKKFLDGAKMQYSLSPALSYEGQYVSFMGEMTFIDDKKVFFRAGFKW